MSAGGVIWRTRFGSGAGAAPYAWNTQGLRTLVAILLDRGRVARRGLPRLSGDTPADIAVSALRHNAGTVLAAGGGHFRAMWTVDTGKAFRGALHALPHDYLLALLDRMVETSARVGRVPTVFTAKRHHDIPWRRADNAPWLLHMAMSAADDDFLARHHSALDDIYGAWFAQHIDPATGLVRRDVHGDWMDTVPRASSTYNNLCALRAYAIAERLGFTSAPAPIQQAERALLEERWTGRYLRAHLSASEYLAADAAVPALYLDVMPEWTQRQLARTLEESSLVRPVPLAAREGQPDVRRLPLLTRLVPSYHTTNWTHLGLMMCVGFKRLGLPWQRHARGIEELVRLHGTFMETVDELGRPYVGRHLATEYHFTMAAGLYLELVRGSEKPSTTPLPAAA